MHPADAEKRGKLKLLPPQPKIKDEEFPTSLQEVDRCYLTDVTGVWSSVMKFIQENCWSDNKILITWRNIASGACPDTPAESSSVPYLPPTALFQLLVCIGENVFSSRGFYLRWQDGISPVLPSRTQGTLRKRSCQLFRLCEPWRSWKECSQLWLAYMKARSTGEKSKSAVRMIAELCCPTITAFS